MMYLLRAYLTIRTVVVVEYQLNVCGYCDTRIG